MITLFNKTSPVPLYHQLKEYLKKDIQSCHLKPGTQIRSERILMREFKLSYPTVTRSLRDLVHEGILVRRKGKGTFVAETVRRSRAKNIGIIYFVGREDFVSNPIASGIMRGIEAEVRRRKDNLLFAVCGYEETELPAMVTGRHAQGLILMSGLSSQAKPLVSRLDFVPTIMVGNTIIGMEHSAIVHDARRGGRLVTEHLLKLGHTRIAFVNNDLDHNIYIQRFEGYNDAFARSGISFRPECLVMEAPGYSVARISRMFPDFTAVIAVNDALAANVVAAAAQCGLRVPQDLSVAGFDDLTLPGYYGPGLTTVRYAKEQMGAKAVQQLSAMIAGKLKGVKETILPVNLIVRASTARPRS